MDEPVFERLRHGPLLCDGAMGTMLYARSTETHVQRRCFDELVLTDPGLVQGIHREYIHAGAQVIETNTFGANAAKLSAYGLDSRTRTINFKAAKLALEARELAGQEVFVAGAVGPTGERVGSDFARLAALRPIFREQVAALADGGVDLLMLETFSNLAELREAVLAARDVCTLPLVAQMTFSEDGQALSGETPAQVAASLAAMGVRILGSNCSVGPAGIEETITEMAAALGERATAADAEVYLSALPNAGLPMRVGDRFLYVSTPAYFAEYARRFARAGVRLIGGCCGTTPAHIAAMRAALTDYLPDGARTTWPAASARAVAAERAPITVEISEEPATPRTRLQTELEAEHFVVSVELDPPKGLNPAKILDGAAYLHRLGVRFINIADSPMARVRMSCLALARLLQERLDVETIIHFTTRDRNLMALQSDLLGAHALGVHNILALTGDPLRAGNYPNLTGVWDADSVELIRVLRGMNEGHDAGGASLGRAARFHIGAALNLNMEDAPVDVINERARRKLPRDTTAAGARGVRRHGAADAPPTERELELQRLRAKLDAGAQYIMTQPIYAIAPLERFVAEFGPVGVPIILGMIPLHSSKHAEYLHNEVPGISIPDTVRARMREAGERGREVGIALAHDVISEARARGFIRGCYLMPSYGRYDLVGELAQDLLRTSSVDIAR